MANRLQLTLAILKPDIALNEKAVSAIRKLILEEQFLVVRTQSTKMSLEKAKEFYQVHENKFFFNRLVYSMSSGTIWCHVLARENAISHWRNLMGPTKVFKTIYEQPSSIRGVFGTTDTRNATHGSDSDQNAELEIDFFFPQFNVNDWYKNEEVLFRNKQVHFDENSFEHKIVNKT